MSMGDAIEVDSDNGDPSTEYETDIWPQSHQFLNPGIPRLMGLCTVSDSNERRYHGYRDGAYLLPNDKREQDRMDLEHRIYHLLLNGKLHRAPLKGNSERVLDLGTGTGTWAFEFAERHPRCEVLGTDLSPIQRLWMPRNCTFEIDDFEEEWQYPESYHFSYIHARNLVGSISDYDKFFAQAYENLLPGGYLEMQSTEANFFSDDGTRERAVTANLWQKLLVKGYRKFGKPLNVEQTWAEKMRAAGFVDVVEEVIKVPVGRWSPDPKMKEIGHYQAMNIREWLESGSVAVFTRVLGWTMEELDVLFTAMRFVYGRRPS
ncbi:hypothetical protein TESG_03743 [Trichophyton tonsurans CBS 112818]|uniref:S-adenosyl-L-methionine-dependent methyltransferase n=1 Tax=Trichophyton tonsurans (strain CBS 112818) TaxID=647933 RepID=F2RY91_TRIT1|nr:hypothetical protein TESG_03743 [Trichophyton tonsurans CBS 112818]